GKAALKETEQPRGPVDLQKYPTTVFNDDWNFIIDNYTVGANDPYLIDSIEAIAFIKPVPLIEESLVLASKPEAETVIAKPAKPAPPVFIPEKMQEIKTVSVPEKPKDIVIAQAPLTIKEKFTTRKT